ncbi:MAG: hypothetical protein JXB17_00825 [Bacteroidales bacterium]|nr:hypothetical protein [Bacteroidales bacterium]
MTRNLSIYILIIFLFNFFNLKTNELFKGDENDYLKEKLYLITDRNIYFSGENIWFKIICTESNFNFPVNISKVIHIELLSNANSPLSKHIIELKDGFGKGYINIPVELEPGNYKLRAYTNWMRNFNENYFFIKNIVIVNPDKEIVFRKNLDNSQLKLNIDFFPESVKIIKNFNNQIIIRVLNQFDEGIDAKARLYINKEIISEVDIFKGIGFFNLKPVDNGNYYVEIIKEDLILGNYNLNDFYERGILISLININERFATFKINSNIENNQPSSHCVKIQRDGIDYYKDSIDVRIIDQTLNIPVYYFPEGISFVNIYNLKNEIKCTRPVYIKPYKLLDISVYSKKIKFKTREKVDLIIKTLVNNYPSMASIAVRIKKCGDPLEYNDTYYITKFFNNNIEYNEIFNYYLDSVQNYSNKEINDALLACIYQNDSINSKNLKYIPELEGNILSGKIINKETRQPEENQLIYLSYIGECAQLYSCRTNSQGRFNFSLINSNRNNEIIVQVNDSAGKFIILLDDQFSNEFKQQKAQANSLKEEYKDYIQKCLIPQQISKAYNLTELQKEDTIINEIDNFYGMPDESIILENFIKLPVMEEVLIELLKYIYIENKRGTKNILIIDKISNEIIGDSPLFLIDGVPVFNSEVILKLDPERVKSINVVALKYFYGDLIFDGILDIHTHENNFSKINKLQTSIRQEMRGVDLPYNNKFPKYVDELKNQERMPDYRNTLYWNPEIITNKEGISEVSFYSSDEQAIYDVIVEGISFDGKYGYTKMQIEVTE